MAYFQNWTPEEDAILTALYGTMPASHVAAKLSRSVSSIHSRAFLLGLSAKQAPWTQEMTSLLRRLNRAGYSDYAIGERLGMSGYRVGTQRKKLGLPSRRFGERTTRARVKAYKATCAARPKPEPSPPPIQIEPAEYLGRKPNEPTVDEIQQRAQAIRAEWIERKQVL